MTKNKQTHWFYLEPYSYISLKNDIFLTYNTLNGEYFECMVEHEMEDFIHAILNLENLFVVPLTENDMKTESIKEFIKKSRKIFVGDILQKDWSKEKPIQFVPAQYFKNSLIPPDFIDGNIIENITEIFFYIDSQYMLNTQFAFCETSTEINKISDSAVFIERVLQQMQGHNVSVHFIGNSLFFDKDYELFFKMLAAYKNCKISFYINYNITPFDKHILNNIKNNNAELVISVNPDFDAELLKKKIKIFDVSEIDFRIEFKITDNSDYEKCELFVDEYGIENFKFSPFYNKENIDFFVNNVFLTKEDIFDAKPSQNDIFARKELNQLNFGQIHICQNGDVYSNLNSLPIGNIAENTSEEIIHAELSGKGIWRKTRLDVEPCNRCIYNLLCPSISNYEYAIGKFNLCNINQ